MQRVRQRDEDAWCRLVGIYTPLIYHWVRRVVNSHADAADVVQEVLTVLSVRIDEYDAKKGSGFRGWLWGITQNKLAQLRRKVARSPRTMTDSQGGMVIAEIPESPPASPREELILVARRAAELAKKDFEPNTFNAFWMTTVDSRPPADVADELGMNVTAVYKAKSRVLARLRSELELHEP